jgi:hypothetical protein
MLLRPHSQRTYTPRTHWQQQLLGAREYYPRAKLERKGQSNHQSERVGALECERVGSQAPKQQRSPATSSSSSGSQRPRHGSTSLSNKRRKRESTAHRTALHYTTLARFPLTASRLLSRTDHACRRPLTHTLLRSLTTSARLHHHHRPTTAEHPHPPRHSPPPAHCGAVTHWFANIPSTPATFVAASVCQLYSACDSLHRP